MKFKGVDGQPIRVVDSPDNPTLDEQSVPAPEPVEQQPQSSPAPSSDEPQSMGAFSGDTTHVNIGQRRGIHNDDEYTIAQPDTIDPTAIDGAGAIPSTPIRPHHGCRRRGCRIFFVLVVVLIGGSVALGFYLKKQVTSLMASETLPLPKVAIDMQEVVDLETRIKDFEAGIDEYGSPVSELTISSEELNMYLAFLYEDEQLPFQARITFPEDDHTRLYRTYELREGQWFNGIMELAGRYEDSAGDLQIKKLIIGSDPVDLKSFSFPPTLRKQAESRVEVSGKELSVVRVEDNSLYLAY